MRVIPDAMWDLWNRGGPFIGADRAHGRVTVQTQDSLGDDTWTLRSALNVNRASPRFPFRWFQSQDNSQVETEVPQVISIEKDSALDSDAAECTITIWNTMMDPNESGQSLILGDPGHFTPRRHGTKSARARWGVLSDEWEGVLAENAMLRTYQGFGGHGLSIPAAVAAGNLLLTGVWLVDEVGTSNAGHLTLKCRDMAKLLIEQPLVPPLVAAGRYPLVYKRWNGTKSVTYNFVSGYDKTNLIQSSPVPAEGRKFFTDVTFDKKSRGYVGVGTDGGVFTRGTSFYGSRGDKTDDGPAMGIAYNPTGAGYWLAISTGTVRPFGTALNYGNSSIAGLIEPGNIDLHRRPEVSNGDGTFSTVRSISIDVDGNEVLIPTVHPSGFIMSDADAIARYEATDEHLGIFDSPVHATTYALRLHHQQELYYALAESTRPARPARYMVGIVPPDDGHIVRIRATRTGRGYWTLSSRGVITEAGDATPLGINFPESVGAINAPGYPAADEYVDFWPTSTGLGFWGLTGGGDIYAVGDAVLYTRNGIVGGNTDILETAVGMVTTRSGLGYWVLAYSGRVYRFGDAAELPIQTASTHPSPSVYVAQGGGLGVLGDPMVAIARTRSGRGLVTITGNGHMWFYGDAVNWGSFNEYFQKQIKLDGNYTDYTDIVADVLLWCGFQFGNDSSATEEVYGLLESTGAWSEDQINPDLFDKKQAIDAIGEIKEIVGYHFWVDDEGAARFVSPNWYRVGNLMADGTFTNLIPEIDERIQLSGYNALGTDKSARSEIVISSADPTAGFSDTITTRRVLNDSRLHGMLRPASWFNGHFTKVSEQEAMAELIEHHIEMTKRAGTVSCVANPAIEKNDQVRIWERNSRETGVHWVRGISTTHDLVSGRYMMTLQVNALPDSLPVMPALRAATAEELEDAEWAEEERVLRA